MNTNDLISQVATETSATKAGADSMVAAVFSGSGTALAQTEPVTIVGFGKFVIRNYGSRAGRNPRTGEPVAAIAASRLPAFKAAMALQDAVNE